MVCAVAKPLHTKNYILRKDDKLMLKKVISLALVVCMLLTMTVIVSANASDYDLFAVVSDIAEDKTFYITFYVKPGDATNLQGYSIKTEFDSAVIAADEEWEDKLAENDEEVFAGLYGGEAYNIENEGEITAVWKNVYGLAYDRTGKKPAQPDETGSIPVAKFGYKVISAAEGINTAIALVVDTSLLSNGNDRLSKVQPNILIDTRKPIDGLVATPVEGLKYTGEAFAAEDLITLNTVDGDGISYVTDPAEVKNAGTYKVIATVEREGCKATEASANVVIGKKDIEVKMADKDMTYGDPLPEFTSDAPAGVTVTATVAENPNAGTVAITATAEDTTGNYNVTVVPGTLTVAKKPIEVKMADKNMTYGDALPEFTSDAPAGVTITPTVETKPNAGTVAITATAESANYDVTVVPGTLTVAKKAITITAQDEFQVQGRGEIAEYKAAVVEGLVEGDEITNIVVGLKEAYTDVEGDYAIEVKSYDDNANYKISTVEGIYSIKTAIPVNVAFGENKKTYGDDDAAVVVTVTKGEDTDDASSLVTITRKDNEAAGTYEDAYEVTLNVATDEATGLPYALNVTGNTFVIEPKAAKITIANASKLVDAADPEGYTFEAVDFLEGEAPAEINITRDEGEKVGEYAITTDYKDANYKIEVVNGVFEIKKRNVKVTAPSEDVNLGEAVPELVAKIEGDALEGALTITIEIYNAEGTKVDVVDTSIEAEYKTKAVVVCDAEKYTVETVDGVLTVEQVSSRPSGGGGVKRPATVVDKEDKEDKEEDKEEDKTEDSASKPSANIAMKEDAKDVNFAVADAENKFNPDVNASRNDVVAVISSLFAVTDVENAPAFTDTEDEAIKGLAAAGVINGYEDGSFQGEKDITRAEFVKLLAAALKLEVVEGAEANFADIEGHWAAEWVKTFAAKGYLVGYPDGTFRPEDKITRAEMIVVATRIAGSVAGEAAVEFADVDASHWAYDFIMKAAK